MIAEKIIIWVGHEGIISGANTCMYEYINLLSKNGFKSIVILPSNGSFYKLLIENKIETQIIPFYSWAKSITEKSNENKLQKIKKVIRNTFAVHKIASFAKNCNAQYIVTNTITFDVAARASKISLIPHIWFVHEFGILDHGFSIGSDFKKSVRKMIELSDKVVYNSIAIKNYYDKIASSKFSSIVHNVTSIENKYTLPPEFLPNQKLKLLMIGQGAPSKNHIQAIKALNNCNKLGLNFILDIYGNFNSNKYFEELSTTIDKFGLKDKILFCGYVDNVSEVYSNCHAMLMCSKMEAFGRVTLESLLCGRPVIGAASGGTIELIEDGVNGYLYSPENENDLSDKIMLFKNNITTFNFEQIATLTKSKYNLANTTSQLLHIFKNE